MENTLLIAERSPFFSPVSRCEPISVLERIAGNGSFPLRLAQEGESVRIVALNGGLGFQDRLAGMGLQSGAEVQILCNSGDGKLVVRLGGTRLFLGGGMAQKIQVVITKGTKP